MDDVTGFNQKNAANDGEKIIESGLKKLRQRYSEHVVEIIRLMLKFDEAERPSFTELSKLVLTSTENSLESPKGDTRRKQSANPKSTHESRKVSKTYSMKELKEPNHITTMSGTA